MGEPWPPGGLAALCAPPGDAQATLALCARVVGSASLEAAAHALVAELAERHQLARVSIALAEAGGLRLLASSQGEPGQARDELAQRLLGAMQEAVEQAVTLCWPDPPGTEVAPGDPLRAELSALHRLVGNGLAILPLGLRGELFGALCLEAPGPMPPDTATLGRVERALVLALPSLHWMRVGALPWRQRLRRDLWAAWSALRQPRHRGRRRLLAAGGLALAFAALAPLTHEVGGRARIEGATQRLLAAPADGFIKAAHVRPGDLVPAGATLVELLEQDLRLARERWSSQLAQHENGYAAALARADRVAAATAMERAAEARAELALLDGQMARGRIVAPFAALVVQGDLSQQIGAPVRQGDALLTLASADAFRVIVEVDEVDVARVAPGQAGALRLSSRPWRSEPLQVERIVPIAKAVDGRNVFEVHASLARPVEGLRPGQLGHAELAVGRMPPLWAWTTHLIDRLRVAAWSWWG